ncbi:MAG TPA: hypothetical protein VHP83_12845 [Aggregatilineaceae bacterium]|nr:hypothetical protein [Aggregatilineaceae bacterium]
MSHKLFYKLGVIGLAALLLALGLAGDHAVAQGDPIPLRVEAAVTGQLTADADTVAYSFVVAESLRMAFVFDVIEGDMQPTLVVLDQDQSTPLGTAVGPAIYGLVVEFPAAGTYYVGLTADSGTSATYRLMIDADPAQPTNAFVVQSYMARGTGTTCEETTPTTFFTPEEDMAVCFTLGLVEGPTTIKVEWWSPSGTIVVQEDGQLDQTQNLVPYLSGIVYPGTPLETGWWQVHILINGELAHIQWVPVQAAQ